MGIYYPGLRSASTPGYPYFAPLGLKSRKKVDPFGKLRDRVINATTVRGSGWAPRQAQGPGFFSGMVSELAELADISCARVKDTAWVINAKNGTPHTRS